MKFIKQYGSIGRDGFGWNIKNYIIERKVEYSGLEKLINIFFSNGSYGNTITSGTSSYNVGDYCIWAVQTSGPDMNSRNYFNTRVGGR